MSYPHRKPSLTMAIVTALAFGGHPGPYGISRNQSSPSVPYPPKPKTTDGPGILDRIQTCESCEAAHLLWYEFLDGANAVSQKTINRATRLLTTLDFPLP